MHIESLKLLQIGYLGSISFLGLIRIIGRPDVSLTEHGVQVSTFMGFNTWARWQGTAEKAAVEGDFTMLADDVTPLSKLWWKTALK